MMMFIFIMVLFAIALAAPALLIYQLNRKLNRDLEHLNQQLTQQRIEKHGNYFVARPKE